MGCEELRKVSNPISMMRVNLNNVRPSFATTEQTDADWGAFEQTTPAARSRGKSLSLDYAIPDLDIKMPNYL